MKYCPNCNIEGDDGFCPDCGIPLIEKPVANDIPGINLGDGNAISGGLNVNASKSIHNEDRSVHNIQNTTSTVNNIQNVAAQKTPMELLQERKTKFLNACELAYEDTVLGPDEENELDRYRMELGLDEATADDILNGVKQRAKRNVSKNELSKPAKIKLKQLSDALKKNDIQAIMSKLDGIEALAGTYANDDELQYKYHLVLSALRHEKCIKKYESSKVDSYWESYWSSLAYAKAGKMKEAEDIAYTLGDKYPNYPEDNATLLASAVALIVDEKDEAADFLNNVVGDYSPSLQRFAETLYIITEPDTAKEMGATEQGCAFYLVNFFGRNLAAEEEARRKAAEEEAKRQAEEDAKRKAAEEETKRQAEEESRRKAEEGYMLVIDGQQAGPFGKEQLQELVQKDVLTGQTYVWKQGMANWEFAENVPEVKALLKQQPDKSAYMLVLNGQQAGPYDMNQLQQLARDGVLTGDTYAWKQGMANWEFAENVKELQAILGSNGNSSKQAVMPDNDALAALCKDIVGSTYIETLHLNRSWILPKLVDMGYKEGWLKDFSIDAYADAVSKQNYDKFWTILVRNLKALAAMKDKSSYAYKIRSGWWTKEVAIAMAEFDLAGFRKYIGNLKVYTNSSAGAYVKIGYMSGADREFRENYYYIDTPEKAPRSGWNKYNRKERTLPNLYAQIEFRISLIRKAKNDKELYEAVRQYNDERVTNDPHFREDWSCGLELADEFINAYVGDGAYSSMMTMVKYLGLRYKDDSGNELDRDECIHGIVNKVFDSGFDGAELLLFCKEKFFDSGVFKYKEYKK